MDIIEKTISNLVESQFPSFYAEEGPIFIEFVKKYYEWLETEFCILHEKQNIGKVSVSLGNNIIIGKNTNFAEKFFNVEVTDIMGNIIQCPRIAIFKEDDSEYIWYNVDTVANNTYMTIKSTPVFAGNNLSYGTVKRQKNPLYHSRHFYEYKDVDETTNQFLLFFKEKYLKDIRFETQTNTRQLIKHALDIYRSKGTERSIDLLFRLVFGREAQVYYPSEDIFKASDGKWHVPRYLEVTLSANNGRFAGKQIRGVNSGAVAFVESVIRKNVKGKLIDILFISAIRGTFETGEIILLNNNEVNLEKIRVIGSLTDVEINAQGIGSGYEVGDIVDVVSPKGEKGKIRVANVSSISGIINYELVNGGWGFSANAEVVVSEKVLTIANVNPANTAVNNYFELFETIVQPKALINFNSANAAFSNGELVFTYHANNLVKGTGKILLANQTANSGVLTVAVYSGDLNVASIYTSSNAKVATVNVASNGYYDVTATANVMGISSNLVFYVSNVSNNFIRNDEVYQVDNDSNEFANAKITVFNRTVGSNGVIRTSNVNGIFDTSRKIFSRSTNSNADIDRYDLNIGVFDITNAFTTLEGNYVYSTNYNTNGHVSVIGAGSGANLGVSNDLIYTEVANLNSDYLITYANVALSSNNYGFPPAGSETLSTIIDNALTYTNYTIGKIQYLTQINQGQNYSVAPFVTVYENISYIQREKDIIISLIDQHNFAAGELVTQQATGARGIVKSQSNTTTLFVEKLFLKDSNNFVLTTNNTTRIVGDVSGSIANVQGVSIDNNSEFLGLNAQIDTETIAGLGAITQLEVIDSGFGYVHNEEVIFENVNGQSTGIAKLGKAGKSLGYYKRNGGFLSDDKKLFDGLYYQEYSYDILSSVSLNKYEEMLKKLLHVAGTKYFGSLVYSSFANSNVSFVGNPNISTITIDS